MPDIPMPKKYREEVTTISPKSHGSWPGSAEKASDKGGDKSK